MRPTDEPARPINLPETMLAPESILFLISDVIVLVWTVLKILVNHLIDSDPHRPNAYVKRRHGTLILFIIDMVEAGFSCQENI